MITHINEDHLSDTTIVAIATAPGKGAVGIVRVSGPLVLTIAKKMLKITPKARYAHYGDIHDEQGEVLDQGIALYFPAPHSFTGEEVLELQGHGGQLVLQSLVDTAVAYGAVLAKPGEFTQRAYLNHKIDLAQAEAVADLIDAQSQQAVKSALRSLRGDFSKHVAELKQQLIQLRLFVEASIDFPDEDIEFIEKEKVAGQLNEIQQQIAATLLSAKQGAKLKEGIKIALIGEPNAGKSSCLNALTGLPSAIVTDIPGTTRDIVKEEIIYRDVCFQLLDTAGLRQTEDRVEQEGIKRSQEAMSQADFICLVIDATKVKAEDALTEHWPTGVELDPTQANIIVLLNKCDCLSHDPIIKTQHPVFAVSAKTGAGFEALCQSLLAKVGLSDRQQNVVMARQRHVHALEQTISALNAAKQIIDEKSPFELLAFELKKSHDALGEITGEMTADDMLGEIFSSFCIGK